VHFAPLDFVKYAEACGAHGVRSARPGDHRMRGRRARATDAREDQESPGRAEESGYEASPASIIPNPAGSAARKIFETISRKDGG
jgi:hypothetical protein